jgi:antirestriction protein ArdC
MASPNLEPCNAIFRADTFFAATGANIVHGVAAPVITRPPITFICRASDFFQDAESYYATLVHETTHWTRHTSRALIASLAASDLAMKVTPWRNWSPNLAPRFCPPISN